MQRHPPGGSSQGSVRVDDAGIHLRVASADGLGVEIGGRRVWAVVPSRDGRRLGGAWLVPWPGLLRPHLNGLAHVAVRSLLTGEVYFEDAVSLGDGAGVVSLVSPEGIPLTVDKQNHVTGTFGDAGAHVKADLVAEISRALEFLKTNGHEAFLAFGCLLGAVREGALIGHDNDADVVYLARATHPVDIILESMAIERQFLHAGWRTRRMSGGTFKLLWTVTGEPNIAIDIFTGFYLDAVLHILPDVVANLPRDVLLPPTTVQLEGRMVAAPADPPAHLEATYGPGWQVPDPTFKFDPPRKVRRKMGGLMRGDRRHLRHWEDFYSTHGALVPAGPSSFACWVAQREPASSELLDMGCGTGRDSVWLAQQGFTVLGCDYSRAGLSFATGRADERDVTVDFQRLNLYDLRPSLTLGALIPRQRRVGLVYARFLLHALEDEGRQNLWRFSRSVLNESRGRIYLEFRTAATKHEFGRHFRRFVHPDLVTKELEACGFIVEHREEGHGLAVHKGEDPRICRVVARREPRGTASTL